MDKSTIGLHLEQYSHFSEEEDNLSPIYRSPFTLSKGDYGVSQARLESRMITALKAKNYTFVSADWFDFTVLYYKQP